MAYSTASPLPVSLQATASHKDFEVPRPVARASQQWNRCTTPFFGKKRGAHGHCPIVVFDNVFKFIAKDGMYKCIKTKLGSQNIFGANYNSLTWSNMASRDFKKSRDKRPKGGCPSYPPLFSSLSRVQRRCGLFAPSHRAIIEEYVRGSLGAGAGLLTT